MLATAQAPGWVVPKQYKGGRQYREYLEQLYAYLMTFYEKTQPLGQAAKQLKKVWRGSLRRDDAACRRGRRPNDREGVDCVCGAWEWSRGMLPLGQIGRAHV